MNEHILKDRRPSLLRDVDKGIKIVNGEGKNICTWSTEQPKQNKNILYQHDKPNEPTKERPLSFVLFKPQFTSVSTVSKGPPFSGNRISSFFPPISIFISHLEER
jgi:hypothetical protein